MLYFSYTLDFPRQICFIFPIHRAIRQDSLAAANEFGGSIDLLFIDGWHEYQGVKGDTDAWLPKLKSGGIVVYHDSGWAPDVKRVIEEDVLPRASNNGNLPNMFWRSYANWTANEGHFSSNARIFYTRSVGASFFLDGWVNYERIAKP